MKLEIFIRIGAIALLSNAIVKKMKTCGIVVCKVRKIRYVALRQR